MSLKIPSIFKWTLFAVAFLMCQMGSSQGDKIPFEKFGVEEGLPEEWPIALIQDELGFIWFNTQNGLVKYDGYQFKVFKATKNASDSTQLQANSGDVFITKDGKIWVGGQSLTSGISSFDPKTEAFKTYKYSEKATNEINLTKFNIEDKQGNLWLSEIGVNFSNTSIYRLDRKTGKFHFYPSIGIKQSFFGVHTNMAETAGNIWLLDSKNNLNKWNASQDSFEVIFPHGSALISGEISDTIRSFIQGQENQLLLTGDYGIYIFDVQKQEVIQRFTDLDSKTVAANMLWYTAAVDTIGHIWITLEGGKLAKIDPAAGREETLVYGTEPLTFSKGPDKIVYWIISSQTKNGIWFQGVDESFKTKAFAWYDVSKGTFKLYDDSFNLSDNPFVNNAILYNFFEDRSGLMWLYTRPNLYKQAPKKRQIDTYTKDTDQSNSLPSDTITCLYQDSKNRMWIGTPNGLAHYQSFTDDYQVYRHAENKTTSLSNNYILSILEDDSGSLWISTRNGLNKWEESSGTFERFFYNPEKPGYCQYLFKDDQGRIWASVLGIGVLILDSETGRILKSLDLTNSNQSTQQSINITNIYQDSKGNIWLNDVIDNSFGLYQLNETEDGLVKVKLENGNGDQSISNRVLYLVEDEMENLWIASSSNGISRFNYATGKVIRYPHTEGFAVISHARDKEGKLWFWSYSGVGLFTIDAETGTVTAYGEQLGLLHNDATLTKNFTIPVDKLGRFWLPTQRGLSVFDPQDKTFTNYYEKDGFQRYGSSYVGLVDSGDDVWIGGFNGLNRVDLESLLQKDTTQPRVVITGMSINESTYTAPDREIFDLAVSYTESIKLEYWQKDIGFEFIALHYLRSEDNMYSWKLENYDKDWSAPSHQRSVSYTNLSPGVYTFRVKASNADGVWNEEGASIKITILPPWWRTWWAYLIYLLLVLLCIYAFIRWRTGVLKKENEILEEKVAHRTDELRESLENLKQTQALLIQSEKMASLGELTAGIAHEIQNPLNFVNNFSEVSQELLEEVEEERAKDPEEVDEDLVNEILQDLKQNLGKINQHGKRADSIVKGMLEHSRVSSGNLSPTDINALADEYLRLSYHGIKAKDQSFNSDFETNFDPALPHINANQQDLGRVILNLINNAFYACNERNKQSVDGPTHEYHPKVTIATRKESGQVQISIKDNGTGIPADIKDKIFQPFFTTKPTGQGTGLGLSLSYDIVKAHGGELLVNSEEGEGTEFVIKLPIART